MGVGVGIWGVGVGAEVVFEEGVTCGRGVVVICANAHSGSIIVKLEATKIATITSNEKILRVLLIFNLKRHV